MMANTLFFAYDTEVPCSPKPPNTRTSTTGRTYHSLTNQRKMSQSVTPRTTQTCSCLSTARSGKLGLKHKYRGQGWAKPLRLFFKGQ